MGFALGEDQQTLLRVMQGQYSFDDRKEKNYRRIYYNMEESFSEGWFRG